jgi:hypothetical protein
MVCLLASLAMPPASTWAQGNDALSGNWTGDWGPADRPGDRNQVTVELKYDGKAVTGVVRTANRQEVTLTNSTYNPTTGAVHMEAEAAARGGAKVKYVIDGKVANNALTGSWNHDNVKGDFKLSKDASKDAVSGSWTGDWGPADRPGDRNQVTVDLKYDGKAVTGVVRTANRAEVTLVNSTYNASTGAIRMEADAAARGGAKVHYVIEGKVTNNTMSGSWNHDNVKGDFKLTKK